MKTFGGITSPRKPHGWLENLPFSWRCSISYWKWGIFQLIMLPRWLDFASQMIVVHQDWLKSLATARTKWANKKWGNNGSNMVKCCVGGLDVWMFVLELSFLLSRFVTQRVPGWHQWTKTKAFYGVSFIAEKNDEMNLQVRSSSLFSQKYRAIFKLPIWRTVTCDGLLPIKAPRRPVSVSLIGNIREKMMIL